MSTNVMLNNPAYGPYTTMQAYESAFGNGYTGPAYAGYAAQSAGQAAGQYVQGFGTPWQGVPTYQQPPSMYNPMAYPMASSVGYGNPYPQTPILPFATYGYPQGYAPTFAPPSAGYPTAYPSYPSYPSYPGYPTAPVTAYPSPTAGFPTYPSAPVAAPYPTGYPTGVSTNWNQGIAQILGQYLPALTQGLLTNPVSAPVSAPTSTNPMAGIDAQAILKLLGFGGATAPVAAQPAADPFEPILKGLKPINTPVNRPVMPGNNGIDKLLLSLLKGVGGGSSQDLLLLTALGLGGVGGSQCATGCDKPGLGGGLDMNSILLALLLGSDDGETDPVSIIEKILRASNGQGQINSAVGDPHFNLGGRTFDFHGNPNAKPGEQSYVRLIDGERIKLNASTTAANHKINGQDVFVSVFHDLAGKVGDLNFQFDADADKLTVNGREVKIGESSDALGLGDGRSAYIARRADGRVEINDGQQTLVANRIGGLTNYPNATAYINLESQVTTDGLREVRGGIFNLRHVGLSDTYVNSLLTGTQSEIDTKLYNLFKVNSLTDFDGNKRPPGAAFAGTFSGEFANLS